MLLCGLRRGAAGDSADRSARLQVLPVAVSGRNGGSAELHFSLGLHIALGLLRATVPLVLHLAGADGEADEPPTGTPRPNLHPSPTFQWPR